MANVLPDISSTTPKVCLFEYEGDGQKLIDACVNQTKTYSAIAGKKAGFMAANQQKANAVTKFQECVLLNATGVRLFLVKPSYGPTPLRRIPRTIEGGLQDYREPSFIEPGECASFLAAPSSTIVYQAQVFEGPHLGWKAPTVLASKDGEKDARIEPFELKYDATSASVTKLTAKALVQDMKSPDEPLNSTLSWTIERGPSAYQFTLTQSID